MERVCLRGRWISCVDMPEWRLYECVDMHADHRATLQYRKARVWGCWQKCCWQISAGYVCLYQPEETYPHIHTDAGMNSHYSCVCYTVKSKSVNQYIHLGEISDNWRWKKYWFCGYILRVLAWLHRSVWLTHTVGINRVGLLQWVSEMREQIYCDAESKWVKDSLLFPSCSVLGSLLSLPIFVPKCKCYFLWVKLMFVMCMLWTSWLVLVIVISVLVCCTASYFLTSAVESANLVSRGKYCWRTDRVENCHYYRWCLLLDNPDLLLVSYCTMVWFATWQPSRQNINILKNLFQSVYWHEMLRSHSPCNICQCFFKCFLCLKESHVRITLYQHFIEAWWWCIYWMNYSTHDDMFFVSDRCYIKWKYCSDIQMVK